MSTLCSKLLLVVLNTIGYGVCKLLQIRGHRFDSGTRLHSIRLWFNYLYFNHIECEVRCLFNPVRVEWRARVDSNLWSFPPEEVALLERSIRAILLARIQPVLKTKALKWGINSEVIERSVMKENKGETQITTQNFIRFRSISLVNRWACWNANYIQVGKIDFVLLSDGCRVIWGGQEWD